MKCSLLSDDYISMSFMAQGSSVFCLEPDMFLLKTFSDEREGFLLFFFLVAVISFSLSLNHSAVLKSDFWIPLGQSRTHTLLCATLEGPLRKEP